MGNKVGNLIRSEVLLLQYMNDLLGQLSSRDGLTSLTDWLVKILVSVFRKGQREGQIVGFLTWFPGWKCCAQGIVLIPEILLDIVLQHTHEMKMLIAQSGPTLCNPMDCSLPGSSVHGIFQAKILKWVAIPFSRGYSQPRNRTWVSCIAGWFFPTRAARISSVQFSSVTQSCPTLCDPMNHSMPGLPVHHHLPELTQTHVHQGHDAIQPSHPLSSTSPPAPNPSQHQSLFQWVSSSNEVSKVLEFQL